ncbi:MDR efflux pump AcrAB transcriptional activator RobA [Pectobacteriaceae bacterium CE90]|nr:MDR efflux pump AcrAB transcriptional activator RobA [Pectobacteriaceae bacterium CE90]
MNQTRIIFDLLTWLESHLTERLSLDKVALKSGYSKWHLQRMFKEVTGHVIGSYIRARRLSTAAVALRLTNRPILDIALECHFDSQQTFTRAFKKQFSQTPGRYRHSPDWNAYGLRPPIHPSDLTLPEATFVTLPETVLISQTQSYTCTLEQVTSYQDEMRPHFWGKFLEETGLSPSVLYGLHQVRPGREGDNELEILYTTSVSSYVLTQPVPSTQTILLEAGDYVQFTYEGPCKNLQKFIHLIYGTCMPALHLTRRHGQDIERFINSGEKKGTKPLEIIRCEYLIPVPPLCNSSHDG